MVDEPASGPRTISLHPRRLGMLPGLCVLLLCASPFLFAYSEGGWPELARFLCIASPWWYPSGSLGISLLLQRTSTTITIDGDSLDVTDKWLGFRWTRRFRLSDLREFRVIRQPGTPSWLRQNSAILAAMHRKEDNRKNRNVWLILLYPASELQEAASEICRTFPLPIREEVFLSLKAYVSLAGPIAPAMATPIVTRIKRRQLPNGVRFDTRRTLQAMEFGSGLIICFFGGLIGAPVWYLATPRPGFHDLPLNWRISFYAMSCLFLACGLHYLLNSIRLSLRCTTVIATKGRLKIVQHGVYVVGRKTLELSDAEIATIEVGFDSSRAVASTCLYVTDRRGVCRRFLRECRCDEQEWIAAQIQAEFRLPTDS